MTAFLCTLAFAVWLLVAGLILLFEVNRAAARNGVDWLFLLVESLAWPITLALVIWLY